jgi:hypothetical protein
MRRFALVLVAGALLLAGCGGAGADEEADPAPPSTTAAPDTSTPTESTAPSDPTTVEDPTTPPVEVPAP